MIRGTKHGTSSCGVSEDRMCSKHGSCPEADKARDRIGREADMLNQLIAHSLSLRSSIESSAERIEKVPVDRIHLVRDTADDANFGRDQNRSSRLVVGEEILVEGSPEMLRSAFENVVSGLSVTRLKARCWKLVPYADRNRGECLQSSGSRPRPSIPDAAPTQLFRPFYRVAEARDRQSRGTRVGLAITERAVNPSGGMVTAANDPRGGLVIEIHLSAAGAP